MLHYCHVKLGFEKAILLQYCCCDHGHANPPDSHSYDYLGDWRDRDHNSNIEEGLLSQNLVSRGNNEAQISRAIDLLKRTATNSSKSLYQRNQETYHFLRYGIQVKVDASRPAGINLYLNPIA